MHYFEAQLARAKGDFQQAVLCFYDRALQFAAPRQPAQRGLVAGLLALTAHESPGTANELAGELLRAHPGSPALLLGFARTALAMDNIEGNQGMEGLRALEMALRDHGQRATIGPYSAACCWRDAWQALPGPA